MIYDFRFFIRIVVSRYARFELLFSIQLTQAHFDLQNPRIWHTSFSFACSASLSATLSPFSATASWHVVRSDFTGIKPHALSRYFLIFSYKKSEICRSNFGDQFW